MLYKHCRQYQTTVFTCTKLSQSESEKAVPAWSFSGTGDLSEMIIPIESTRFATERQIYHSYCLVQKEADLKTLAFVWLAGRIIYLNRIVFQVDSQQWGVGGQLGHLGQIKMTFPVSNIRYFFTSLKSSTLLLFAQNSSKLVMCSRPEKHHGHLWLIIG